MAARPRTPRRATRGWSAPARGGRALRSHRFGATGDTRRAVAEGLSTSARTITSAALIMVAVFAVFVSTGVTSIRQLGLGSAVAIAVDATVVRLVPVPKAVDLLGRWNWWVPAPLGRLLPRRTLEEAPA